MTNRKRKGFTLIEMILYVAIVAIVMTALVPMAWNVVEAGAKSSVQQEVQSTARYLAERIDYEIRNSTSVTVTSASSISLTKTVGADNPTIISWSSPDVTVKRGANPVGTINSGKTLVTSLVFTNYTSADSRTKHVGYTMTLTGNYPAGRQEFAQSVNMESSAEVRGL